MKLFKCDACGQVLLFENTKCEKCARRLGYSPQANAMMAVEQVGGRWTSFANPARSFRFCRNAEYDCCNWLVPADSPQMFCDACLHNGIVPNTAEPDNLALWRKIEGAKHRLFYSLLRLRLPLQTRNEDPEGLIFEFLTDSVGPKVMTGHDNGRVTIALAEADDPERERRRSAMGEPYRTLLGHFRHEIGHYYWDRLVRDTDRLAPCRAAFGDDSRDYAEALRVYYENGAPADWRARFVSAYATAHPWEDFAETWAHYFHIVDTLEMTRAFGINFHPGLDEAGALKARIGFDPYKTSNVAQIVDAWLPLTFAFNSINRCMGQADLYPFVLGPGVMEKLGFIHELIRDASAEESRTRAAG